VQPIFCTSPSPHSLSKVYPTNWQPIGPSAPSFFLCPLAAGNWSGICPPQPVAHQPQSVAGRLAVKKAALGNQAMWKNAEQPYLWFTKQNGIPTPNSLKVYWPGRTRLTLKILAHLWTEPQQICCDDLLLHSWPNPGQNPAPLRGLPATRAQEAWTATSELSSENHRLSIYLPIYIYIYTLHIYILYINTIYIYVHIT
jgi:hypothetical protein